MLLYGKIINSQFIILIGGAINHGKMCNLWKTLSHGNKLSITRSHVSNRASRTWKPNLRTVKTIVDGQPKKIKVCAKCLRSGKVKELSLYTICGLL